MKGPRIYSTDELSINIMKPAPFYKQLGLMLKISFLQRFRASTITLEIILPIIFLIFDCLFAARIDPYTESLPHPQPDPIVPFSVVSGSKPSYGMIPKNNETSKFIDILNEKSVLPIKENVIFFDTFQEYKEYIWSNREIDDLFYCTEWDHNLNYTQNSIRISSNGMTVGSLPFLIQNLGSTIINLTKSDASISNPIISLNYKEYPHSSIFKSDRDNALFVAIFSAVPFLSSIMNTGTYYGTEAEEGLRDLFTFFGLSFFVNELRWYILNVVLLFVISIPFVVALTLILKISFGLLILFYFLISTSYSSFLFFMMSLWPTRQMASVVSYGILFTLFICIFWGYFDFLNKESGYIQKYILSILPNVALSYTMEMMASGDVTKFSQVDGPLCYPVKYGLIFLAAQTFVYFCLFILIEALKTRLWLPAPIKWGKSLDYNRVQSLRQESSIIVENVSKIYPNTIALDDVSFDVKQGETLAIVGPNGAGKSTLMSLLSGTSSLDKGRIFFKGIDIMKNTKMIHQVVGLCPQKNLFMNELKLDEWMKTVCTLRNVPDFDYSDILMSLGLEDQRQYQIGKMSGGNQRKTCLAASLVCHPPIVILDEATSGVDFTSRTRIWSIISGLSNTTVIMATHTLEECEKIADRIMVLVNGKIAFLETPNELRQIFKCGYIIITDEENIHQLEQIENEAGLNNSIVIEDGKVKLSVSSDDSYLLAQILQKINFKYILAIQSLEETIFHNIQNHEMNQSCKLGNDETDNSFGDSDLLQNHPNV